MEDIQNLKFPNNCIRCIIKSLKDDILIKKGVEDLLSRMAVISTSFIACVIDEVRKEHNDPKIKNKHIQEVLKKMGIHSD